MSSSVWGLRLTDAEHEFLEHEAISTDGILSKTGVIRVLIRDAMETGWKPLDRVDRVARLAAYPVGAGTTGQVTRQLTPQQPSPLTGEVQASLAVEAVEAVQAVAQEIEPPQKKEGIKSKKPRVKRTKGSPEFETFWSAYQAIDHRANKQAKPQAWEVWKQLMDDGVSPDDLTRALSVASDDVDRRLRSGEFASPFPDCFRWLRDECYAVYLEDHQSPSSQITVYG